MMTDFTTKRRTELRQLRLHTKNLIFHGILYCTVCIIMNDTSTMEIIEWDDDNRSRNRSWSSTDMSMLLSTAIYIWYLASKQQRLLAIQISTTADVRDVTWCPHLSAGSVFFTPYQLLLSDNVGKTFPSFFTGSSGCCDSRFGAAFKWYAFGDSTTSASSKSCRCAAANHSLKSRWASWDRWRGAFRPSTALRLWWLIHIAIAICRKW